MNVGLKISSLGLLSIFTGVFIATVVLFLYYTIDWADGSSSGLHDYTNHGQRHRQIQVSYVYKGAVLALLFILSGMHGYVVLRRLI